VIPDTPIANNKMQKEKLYGKTLNELIAVTERFKLPGYTAKQIADWLYKKEIMSIDEMTNLSGNNRQILSENYSIGLSAPLKVAAGLDGTKKYLYNVLDDKFIETAYIPDKNRGTICISTQAGCNYFKAFQYLVNIIQRFTHTHVYYIGDTIEFRQTSELV
jgi:23S rRNA (adenine2503-C2)-methyltransferase